MGLGLEDAKAVDDIVADRTEALRVRVKELEADCAGWKMRAKTAQGDLRTQYGEKGKLMVQVTELEGHRAAQGKSLGILSRRVTELEAERDRLAAENAALLAGADRMCGPSCS